MVLAAPPLDHPIAISRFLAADAKVPTAAKTQLLFVLAVLEDLALGDAFRTLVLPGLAGTRSRLLSVDDISCFLNRAAETRSEVARWTEQTRSRWGQGLRLVLREAGFVGSDDKNGTIDLRPPVVRDEVIALLCHAVEDRGLSGWPILRHAPLNILLPNESDALRAARALNSRGWWSFAQSGHIMEFLRNHASLEEWLDHGLGI